MSAEIKDLQVKIEKQHEVITEMRPTLLRLDEVFKPQGKFDRLCDAVNSNQQQICLHTEKLLNHNDKIIEQDKKINRQEAKLIWIFGLVTTTIIGLIMIIIELAKHNIGG